MNNNDSLIDQKRRSILGGTAAAIAGLTIAPGVFLTQAAQAKPVDEAISSKTRWGILIDTNNCNDCNDCVTACEEENGWGSGSTDEKNSRPDQKAQWIRTVKVTDKQTGYAKPLPMMCQHCAEPACVDACPTGASFKRADGIVLVDKHTCIGCRYCMMACPYKARSFIHEVLDDQKPHAPRGKGTVESCTLCVHRVDAGRLPACVESCSKTGGGAMLFGDLKDPDSEISKRVATYATQQVRADLGLDPGVRYSNL